MDWLDLLAVQGTLKSLRQYHSSKAWILLHSAFFIVQLSHPYMTTGKTIALTRWTFVGKVMSLLFNMLSRLIIAFLPSSNFMAAVTICSDFRAPKNSLSLFPLFSHLFATTDWFKIGKEVHQGCILSPCLFNFCQEKYSEKAMAPHSSTFPCEIPWMEEPGALKSMGSLRVGHDWATSLSLVTFMYWTRKWQSTPVFLPGESQGWGSLVGCRLWGCKESDTTEVT